jgi:hypothetical protein
MSTATVVVSILLASALAYAALRKLGHRTEVVATYTRVGVPEERLDALAAILLAGAAGLIAGLFWQPLGIAAATCLVVYFAVAVAFHIRSTDLGNAATPVALALASAAVVALQLAAS